MPRKAIKKLVIKKPKVRRAPVPAEKTLPDKKREQSRRAGRKPVGPEEQDQT